MKDKEFMIGVHWTEKWDGTFYILFSDGTWEAYSLPRDVDKYGIKAYLNLRVCTQKKMNKQQVDEWINYKMAQMKKEVEKLKENGEL